MTDFIPNQRTDEPGSIAVDLTAFMQESSARFFAAMEQRHLMGQEKYGPIKFAAVNTLREAKEEVIDLANYAMYTYLKLDLLDQQIQDLVEKQPDMLGPSTFMKD